MSDAYKRALTRADRKAINDAYNWLHEAAQIASKAWELDEAERIERRQRSCLISARALIVECAFRPAPSDPLVYSPGCRFAALLGNRLRSRREYPSVRAAYRRFRKLAPAAIAAHNGAIDRAMRSLGVRHD